MADRPFGPNFDPAVEWDRNFIDKVHAIDSEMIEAGVVKPIQMIADIVLTPPSIRHYLAARLLRKEPSDYRRVKGASLPLASVVSTIKHSAITPDGSIAQ